MQRKRPPLIDELPVPALKGPHGLAELVKKIETSAKDLKKRLRICQSKIKKSVKEFRRLARVNGLFAAAITLTYKRNEDFAAKNISQFISSMRASLKRKGFSLPYIWVLERAAKLHYHLVVWLPRSQPLKAEDLQRWWKHGSTDLEACRNVASWTKYAHSTDGGQ